MANKEFKNFEALIQQIDRLPSDMPQDFSTKRRKSKTSSEERAPVKQKPIPAVESKIQNTVNNLVETNNQFQSTQNKIINQQMQAANEQFHEDKQQTAILGHQTDLMQSQSKQLRDLNKTMAQIFMMLKESNEKLTPKIQQNAANKEFDKDLGKPQNPWSEGGPGGNILDSLGDMFGGRRGKDKSRRERARERLRERKERNRGKDAKERESLKPKTQARKGIAGVLGRMSAMASSGGRTAKDFYESIKSGGGRLAAGGLGGAAGAAIDGFRKASGNKFVRAGAAALAAGAAIYGGKSLYDQAFGSVSAKYESGKKGVDAISSGKGDHGGVSYGKYQLATNNGSMNKFLKSEEAQQYAPYFEGMQPGTAQFNAVYSKLAAEDPNGFGRAQQQYMMRTHYDPMAAKLEANGVDVSNRGRAVQEMVFSTATQYGVNSSVMLNALRDKDTKNMSDEQIINAVQDYKRDTVGQYFKSSSAGVQQSVANRSANEKNDLLAMMQAEKDAKAGIDREQIAKVRGDKAPTEPERLPDNNVVISDGDAYENPEQVASTGILSVTPQTPSAIPSLPGINAPISGTEAAVTAGAIGIAGAGKITYDQMKRRGTQPITDIKGADAIKVSGDVKPSIDGKDVAETKGAVKAEEAAGKAAGKTVGKAVSRGVPVVGTLLTAAEAASVATDDSLSTKEKGRELTKVGAGAVGGAAGGWAGAAGGAATGGALGMLGGPLAPITVPIGSAIGGIVGGIGGSWIGSEAGEKLGEMGYDKADEILSRPAANDLDVSKFAKRDDGSNILLMPRKAEPKAEEPQKKEPITLQVGNQTFVAPQAANVEIPKTNTEPPATVTKTQMPDTQNVQSTVAQAVDTSASQSFVQPRMRSEPTPTVQSTPQPKTTNAAWSSNPVTTTFSPQIQSQTETPMERVAFADTQRVEMNTPPVQQAAPPSNQQQRIQGSGVAEGNSVRPELKDVVPMVTDFGIALLNSGLV